MTEVRLFATCLAEEFYPSVIESANLVLERLKLKVRPVRSAFCCAQAPFNEGLRDPAIDSARRFLKACEPGTPVVIPSGSCTSMVKVFYSTCLPRSPRWRRRRSRYVRGCSNFHSSWSMCSRWNTSARASIAPPFIIRPAILRGSCGWSMNDGRCWARCRTCGWWTFKTPRSVAGSVDCSRSATAYLGRNGRGQDRAHQGERRHRGDRQ